MANAFLADIEWEELDGEACAHFIAAVKSIELPTLFECNRYVLYKSELSFYDGYAIYALSNQTMIPCHEMYYLSNGENHQYLDATIFPFQALNNLDALSLNARNVEDYLAFYFSFVFDPDRKIHFISDPLNTPYSGASAMRQHFNALTYHAQKIVRFYEDDQCFHVIAPLLHDGEMVMGDIAVSLDGVITVKHPVDLILLDNSVDDAKPSYIHPAEEKVLEANKEILRQSEEGRRLLALIGDYGVRLRILAGLPHCGFALKGNEGFIVVPAYQLEANPYQVLDMAASLRECEHILMQEPRPAFQDGEDEFHALNIDANLDLALILCKIVDECADAGYVLALEKFRKMGFGRVYSGYKNGKTNEELYELCAQLMYDDEE